LLTPYLISTIFVQSLEEKFINFVKNTTNKTMFLKLLIPAIALIGFSSIFLGIRMILLRNGKFPQTEVGHNKEMRKRGIICAKAEEIKCRRDIEGKTHTKNPCSSCHL